MTSLPSDAPLYLASASPRRSQLLAQAGIIFQQFVVPIDEDALAEAYTGPLESLGEYLAQQKALAAYAALQSAGKPLGRVLASDTTVLLAGRSLAKPRDHAEAASMLGALRDREHIVATGVALVDPAAGVLRSATSATRVRMRAYSDDEIAAYVATGDPLDKAGAYSIQHPAFQPVATLAGCHLGVIGLPICLVAALLAMAGEAPDRAAMPTAAMPTAAMPTAAMPTAAMPTAATGCPWSSQCRAPYPTGQAIRSRALGVETAKDAKGE